MERRRLYIVLNFLFAATWFVNGLFCKVLGLVPRHRDIIATLFGNEHAYLLIIIIGILEIGLAVWIISGIRRRLCTVLQIGVILTMNIIEFLLVPDLLLWGKINIVFAIMFCAVIFINEFIIGIKRNPAGT